MKLNYQKNELTAYAMSFASFVMASEAGNKINNIILFGSVAKNEFDKESDVDIFIDTDAKEKEILKQLKLFYDSQYMKTWRLIGIENEISLHVGQLDKHPLKRSIVSSGLQLYGKFMSRPENLKYYMLFVLDFGSFSRKQKVSAWRKLYGYSQKIGAKRYQKIGIIKNLYATRLEKNVIAVPAERQEKFISFVKNLGIDYKIYEIWSDSL